METLQAYKERAEEVHFATNALTCWIDEAEDQAKEADAYLARTGKTLGPLHGVPCTVKDHYAVKGYPVTMGLRKLRERQEAGGGAKHDSALVMALQNAGAIIFAKTNMTQLGDTWGGGNPAYGDSLNPWNTLRTTGGSSSGEGAIVGANASAFGIGSDVGGSVRTPAGFCGITALKPTAFRCSFAWDDGRTIMNHPGDCASSANFALQGMSDLRACRRRRNPCDGWPDVPLRRGPG